MPVVNQVGNTLTGRTGTGTFVGANTPTLITPVLGAATATSINFGGSTLSTYTVATSFAPVFTFATPGDLSVVYSNQGGYYTRIGNFVHLQFYISFTPTHTTASGESRISLPFACLAQNLAPPIGNIYTQSSTFPAGTTSLALQGVPGQSYMLVYSSGTGTAAANWSTTQYPTGVALLFAGSISYMTT